MLALLPVQRLDRAKGRLAELLAPAEREQLALATLRTVLDALAGAGMDAVIVTPDEDHLREALNGRCEIMAEDPAVGAGLNPQLERAVAALRERRGVDELLILHGDLPLASAQELQRVAGASAAANTATLVESRDGGTNAMLLRPPGRFPLAYGPCSFAKHERAASEAGMATATVKSAALSLDLDTPSDLRALLSMPEGRESTAGQLLIAMGMEQRLEARP